jgi:pyruvate dehydrogenase E2 component (dihydrolipoamide acetyltransferase)
LIKALVACLRAFPRFNSGLKEGGDTLNLKKYFNIGVAVESPVGLLVPVVNQCDLRSLTEIASSIAEFGREGARQRIIDGRNVRQFDVGIFSRASRGNRL